MTVVENLGFAADARVVVVHVDDVGMSPAANQGALEALAGAATCGSIMVPCPAFEEIAQTARERDDLDLGVHLTLNAEYETYRWGPVRDDVPSLVSPDGGMWRSSAETQEHATVEDVERELRAQIDRAYAAGIDVTHLDVHMGTAFDARFVAVYVKLIHDYRLPGFIPRVDRKLLAERGLAPRLASYVDLVDGVEKSGVPIFDHFNADSLQFPPGTGAAHNRSRIDGFGPGLSYLITHCAQGGAALESITPDWRQRDEERRIYSDGSMAAHLREAGVVTIGMRPLRELMRSRLS